MIPSVLRRSALPLSLLALLTLSAAYRRQVVETRPTIPLVREILADKSGPRMQMLRDLPERRALLHATRDLTADQVRQMAAFLEGMRNSGNNS